MRGTRDRVEAVFTGPFPSLPPRTSLSPVRSVRHGGSSWILTEAAVSARVAAGETEGARFQRIPGE